MAINDRLTITQVIDIYVTIVQEQWYDSQKAATKYT